MENSSKGTILVTGGTGYIGSHTTVELIQKGYEVVIIDNLSNSQSFILNRIFQITQKKPIFYEFDLCNLTRLKEVFANHVIIGVIHFAAAKSVSDSVKNPLFYYRNNVIPIVNLLEVMIEYKVVNFCFSSSCCVYGQPDQLPVTEEAEIKAPECPYGYTKQINENVLKDTINSGADIRGIALRYFNVIGAHDSGLIGELPYGVPANLLPYITQTAYGIREQLSIFGSDYNTPDGTAIRDYIHVVDLSQAHIIAIERLIEKKNKDKYEIFNLGSGHGYSVLEVVKSFERSTGEKLNYKFVGRRDGDIEQIWADVKKANEVLGFKT